MLSGVGVIETTILMDQLRIIHAMLSPFCNDCFAMTPAVQNARWTP